MLLETRASCGEQGSGVRIMDAKDRQAADLSEREDPFDVINSARMEEGRITELSAERIPWDAYSTEPFEDDKDTERDVEQPPPAKVHPVLRRWIAERSGDEVEQLIVNLRDDLRLPRFPEPAVDEPRDSETNEAALRRAEQLVDEITERRAGGYEAVGRELAERHRAEVLETFWLVNAVLVQMPLGAVPELAEREDVLYVEPRYAGDEPGQNTITTDDVDDGRARIVSDPYFNLGLTGGWIGILDTGVRATHTLLSAPSNVDFRRDCVNGGADCNTGSALNPNDDCWDHGTGMAAVIAGNGNSGVAFRGVTGVTVDSFKIFPSSRDANGNCNGFLDRAAMVRAFQVAVRVLDRVIVSAVNSTGGDDLSSIAIAGDNAFDAGAVVIAIVGNRGPGAGTVGDPGNAHRVIGVGNFDVQTQAQIAGQSRGPAPDGRVKPDIQAPTNTETASNASDTAFGIFSGTSGASPYAAGAAALLRNWLRGASFSIDPGQVYAQMILSGQRTFPFDNTSGAGPLRLPTDGLAWWGKVSVGNGLTIDIPLDVRGGTPNTLDGALWWPEAAYRFSFGRIDVHNDIDLHLIDPSGSARASSVSIPSVFERARVSGPIQTGVWKLRVRGFSVPWGSQTVYWAAHVRR